MDVSFRLAELERRLLNMIRFGAIASVDLINATCRVKINDDLTTGDLPWQSQRAGNVRTWSPPSMGEQVMIISPAGDLSQAAVMPSIYQTAHPAPSANAADHLTKYDDGAVISYNQQTHALEATLPAGGTINLDAPGGITVTGNMALNGDMHVTGKSTLDGVSTVQGKAIARKGDMVGITAGSSAGTYPITTGSV